MDRSHITIAPATPERWPAIADLFRVSGDSAGCWCAWFRMRSKDWDAARVAGRRGQLEALIAADVRPGLVAYVEDEAVGWASVVPRRTLARIEPPRDAPSPDGPPPDGAAEEIWAISCFVIRPGHRRRGVAGALLDAAVAHARAAGADAVEGYPSESPRSDSSAYTGVPSMYLRLGFREVGRFDRWAAVPAASGPEPRRIARPPGRPLMRLDLS